VNQHVQALSPQHQSIARAALVTAGVLLIPLWGNLYVDGWNWDWHGFVAAGTFVFTAALAYELVARTMRNTAYRFAAGLAVATALVLTWMNLVLAADVNPFNVMYLGVVVVGVIGAAIARLRARGMALALIGTAMAQTLVPVIALVLWKTNLAPGGPVRVFGLNGVFIVLFAMSALMFRRAARRQDTSPTRA
jgi:hypothetical protein